MIQVRYGGGSEQGGGQWGWREEVESRVKESRMTSRIWVWVIEEWSCY